HPRGSWCSGGSYTLAGQIDDTRAALAWARAQPGVAAERLALVGGSVGGYTVLRCASADRQLAAVVALCPVVTPREFAFSPALADEFAGMLHGVSGAELLAQWSRLVPLADHLDGLHERPLLLVTGDRDELFPPAHYAAFAAALPNLLWRRHSEGDHAFSGCRSWL